MKLRRKKDDEQETSVADALAATPEAETAAEEAVEPEPEASAEEPEAAPEPVAEPLSSQTFEWTPPAEGVPEPTREIPAIPLAEPPEPTPEFSAPFTAQADAAAASAAGAERPELLVGAAFAGGMVAAMLLKRLGR